MKLLSVAPGQGLVWVRSGFRTFFRQPLAYAGLFAAFLFAVFVLSFLPFVGPLLLLAMLPLGSLGFMLATRASLQGRFPTPRLLVEPLKGDRRRRLALLQLGLLYAACSIAIIWLSDLADGGTLGALMDALSGGKATPQEIGQLVGDPRLLTGLVLRFGLAGVLAVPYWHAPPLVHWDGQGVAQSLFSSTVACWRNKGAFLLFAAGWAAVVLGFAVVANLVGRIFGVPQLVALLAMPASLVLSTAFYASLYFTFADCFGEASTAPVATETPTP